MSAPLDRLAAALGDRYGIERELGAGGMATVYLAHDLKHDRKVAVKVLQHPHILPLFDSGAADSFLFYVMPFIEGESAEERQSDVWVMDVERP